MYWINDDGHKRQYSELAEAVASAVEQAVIGCRVNHRHVEVLVMQTNSKGCGTLDYSTCVYAIQALPSTPQNFYPNLTITNYHN